MMNVYFITHSCFLVEFEDRYLLFDYFDNAAMPEIGFSCQMPVLDDEKHLYVFSSHGHKDHFSLEVLKWAKDRENVTYILSKHIRLGRNYLLRNGIDLSVKEKIKFVAPVMKYKIDDMEVETLRSNDEGVAFLVCVNGKLIFHSGDLNWWNTQGKGELYGNKYGGEFKKEIHRIGERRVDVAFVVLDPRVGDGYYLGMDYFIKTVDADYIFPMHMWNMFDTVERFKRRPDLGRLAEKVVDIDRENIKFELGD